MAKVKQKTIRVRRGVKMQGGKGWRLMKLHPGGVHHEFVGTLLGTHNLGGERLAVFSVPKRGGGDE